MNTSSRIWILGADDPEMSAIEGLLRECGETVVHATVGGQRVHPGNAYRCDPIETTADLVYSVECARDPSHTGTRLMSDCPVSEDPDAGGYRYWHEIHIDHHRPGDPGYGVPPAEFFRGSSLGQVIVELERLGAPVPECWGLVSGPALAVAPQRIRFSAAADHCLGAAYAGQCPGVDVEAFGEWRLATRAAHQGLPIDEVRADVERACERVKAANSIKLSATHHSAGVCEQGHDLCPGCGDCCCQCATVADLRGEEIPELPEAACRLGVAYLATPKPGPDGRRKVVLQCASAEHLAAWPAWAAANGIVDCYGGDPARGFAGGYCPRSV